MTTTPGFSAFWSQKFAAGGPPPTAILFGRAGAVVGYGARRLRLSPNFLTVASLVVGIAGTCSLGLTQSQRGALIACALMLLAFTLDCADGQLARASGQSSDLGYWLDICCDAAVSAAFAVACLARFAESSELEVAAAIAFGASRSALLMATFAARFVARTQSTNRRPVSLSVLVSLTDTPVVFGALAVLAIWPSALAIGLATSAALAGLNILGLGVSIRRAQRRSGSL